VSSAWGNKALLDLAPAGGEKDKLGLNRASVNPLASGGRQLLLDILRTSEGDTEDSAGEGAISALVESGYYTDLDLEWAREGREEKASLIFDAKEKSKTSAQLYDGGFVRHWDSWSEGLRNHLYVATLGADGKAGKAGARGVEMHAGKAA